MSEASGEMQEQARSVEAACEIFKNLPRRIQRRMIFELYKELVNIYIGKPSLPYDEVSRSRGFTEMFAKLPEDSKYRRHFFVLGSDKDLEELTPEEKEIFGEAFGLLQRQRNSFGCGAFWLLQRLRNCFGCGAGRREMQELPGSAEASGEIFKTLPVCTQDDMARKLFKELKEIYIGDRPQKHNEDSWSRRFAEMFAKLPEDSKYRRHFFVLGSDKDLEELTPEEKEIFGKAFWLLQRLRNSFGCGASRREMQEQPGSVEAAAEIFKYLGEHAQHRMIVKLRDDLIRDIHIDIQPYESDEDSRVRRFTGLFRKLPEDSKFRRHFFVLVSNKYPEELTPEEKEILKTALLEIPPLRGGGPCSASLALDDESEATELADGELPLWNEFIKVKTFTLKGSSTGGQTSGGVSGTG